MRILFITDTMPYPPVSGNRLRVYHLCRRMARDNELWLAVPLNGPEDEAGLAHMREFCHKVITAPRQRQSRVGKLAGMARYALRGWPPELYFDNCQALAEKLREVTAAEAFDVVHIEPSYLALYREALSPDPRRITTQGFHNVESALYRSMARISDAPAQRIRSRLHSMALHRWEPRYAERFDLNVLVSEDDQRDLLRANARLETLVSPNGVDVTAYQPLPQPERQDAPALLFVGSMNYAPCVDAVLWFCSAILPGIRAQVPDVKLWIVGRNPVPEVQALDCDRIHVTGWVDDVRSYYTRSSAVVVPLRAGGGTRLKIVEAMALGRPIVSTALGCQGLDVVDGKHLLIADQAQAFTQATVRLLRDASLRLAIVQAARALVVERYDWDVIAAQLLAAFAELLPETATMPEPGRRSL